MVRVGDWLDQTFKTLMSEDANDFAAEYKVSGKRSKTPGSGTGRGKGGTGRGRGRPKKKKLNDLDAEMEMPEDEMMDGDPEEDYSP
eukprot:7767005-Pyramimonas_sp.AAC.1